ncbi:MAG TPA: sel1 repeat family protein [Novosphingobium sp.]|nr:sel1 repeat family protein [Novosphingobium sp.]
MSAQGGASLPLPAGVPADAEAWRALLSGPAEAAAQALYQAALAGDAEAQLLYGQHLLDGAGVVCDPAAALGWFHAAAQAGLPAAINMVGRCLDQGWGTPPDPAAAAAWFEAAAARGLDWGLYNLATALALGRGLAQDRPRALALFRRAAAMGHAKSMNMVGSFHEDGWSVPPSRLLAAYHYARAAEGGDFRGAFNHARLLIEEDQSEAALPWLNRAHAAGTARFAGQMAAWLAARPEPALRQAAARWQAETPAESHPRAA